MSLLGLTARNSLENPSVSFATGLTWLDDSGPAAGVRVDEHKVYGLTAWYRAVALMAGVNATLPFFAMNRRTNAAVVQSTVLDDPCPATTPFEFWQTHYAHALSWGTAYARKVRNGAGIVTELWQVHPSCVHPRFGPTSAANPSGKLFDLTLHSGEPVTLTPYDLFETPYLSLNGLAGTRPMQLARESLGIAIAAERAAAGFYGKGSRLSGVLQSKKNLDKRAAERLKSDWRKKTSGPDNAGEIAVLDNETSFQAISIPPVDAQLLESRKFSVTEIARLFGIPPHLLGDVTTSTSWGTGIAEQTDGFVKFTLLPWLELIEQRVDREILPGGRTSGAWVSKHDLTKLLAGTPGERAAFYSQAISDGWLNRAEVRGREGLEFVEGLDQFLVSSKLTLIASNGEIIPLAAGGTNPEPEEPTNAAA